ncbi:hypothetical protein [Aureivirga marina]|uniref:hypothetical protein n=1 Tax=Aureivirga marina TaxID=1182451 RepID=UPI0018CA3CD2|nr:hypothetical protein [Aureivirga marina]
MRKFSVLFFTFFLLLACSNDDDSTIASLDLIPETPITKTWTVVTQIDDGELIALDDCNWQYSMEIKEDKSCIVNRYLKNESGECINYTAILKWGKNEDGQYHFESEDGYFHADGVLVNDALYIIFYYDGRLRRYKMK